MSDHLRKVQSELFRQAESFACSPTLRAPGSTARVAEALGDVVHGRLLREGGRLVALDVPTSADAATATLHDAIERLRDPSHAGFATDEALLETIREAARGRSPSGSPRRRASARRPG